MKIGDVEPAIANIPVARTDNQRGRQGTSAGSTPETGRDSGEDVLQLEVTSPAPDRILLNRFEGVNDAAQAIAQQIRSVNNTLELVQKHIVDMKQVLESVAKAYPPFPHGSAERVAALRQFIGLRKIIDQLTFPPLDDSPDDIPQGCADTLSDPSDLKLTLGRGKEPIISGYQDLFTGAADLDIPELSTEASDEKLHDALRRVVNAHREMRQRHEGFIKDAHRIIARIS